MATIQIRRPAARSNILTSLVPLVAVMILGAALRFFELNGQSIWFDEAYAIDLAKQPFSSIITNIQPAYLPLHPLLLRVWIMLMGQSEISVRLLSLVFSVATIPATYILGKRLFNSWIGLVGSAIVALSPFMVFYAQETKMYSILGFQAAITTYLLLRALDGDRRWWFAYAFVSATLVYNHYFGVLFLGAQAVFTLIWFLLHPRADSTRRVLAPWILTGVFLGLLFLPWALPKMGLFDTFISSDGAGSVGDFMFWKTVIAFNVGQSLGTLNPSLIGPLYDHDQELAALLSWGSLLVALLGIISTLPWPFRSPKDSALTEVRDAKWRSWLLVMVLIVVTGGAVYVACYNKRGYNPRYLITLAPVFYLLVACGLDQIRRRARLLVIPIGAFIIGVMLFSLNHYYFDPQYAREDFRAAAEYMQKQAQPGEAILCSADYSQQAIGYYYNDNVPLYGLPTQVPMDRAATEKALAEITSHHQFLWFVLWQDYYSDPDNVLFKWLHSHAIPIGPQKAFHGGIRVQGFLTAPPTVDPASVPNPRSESFGGKIELVGYEFSQPKQGQTWPITLYLKALVPLDKDYTFFLHLIGPGNQGWTQRDDRPYSGGYRFPQWKPGEIVKVETSIDIPAFSPPADYRLELGFYDPATSEVLKTKQSDRVVFESIRIAPDIASFPPATTTCQYEFADQLSLRGHKIDVNGRESLTVITYWQALGTSRKDFLVSIQLLNQTGQIVAQKQASPGLKSYPTSAWPQNQTIVDYQWLQLPPNLPAGTYRLAIGIADQQSNQMLLSKTNQRSTAQEYFEITSFELH